MKLAPWRQSKRTGLRWLYLAGLSALMALLLVACGASSSNTGGSTSNVILGGTGLTIRPCPGDYTGDLHPSLTLSNSASVSGSARVGEVVEIRLDGHHRWTLESVKPASALASKGNKDALDRVDGVCVWDFQATAPGDVTVTYSGAALCDPTQICPDSVIRQAFKVHIS